MINERIYLYENDNSVYLDTYVRFKQTVNKRDAILVIPGGGYTAVSEREGECTALAFLGRGYNTFVVTYNVDAASVFPRQLTDVALAIRHIKENAEKYHINPERIFVLGYSAGGHILGTLLTHANIAEEKLSLPENYLKVKGGIFCYPVVTAFGNTHVGSFRNLLNKPLEEYTEEEKTFFSIEKNVTASTPKAFIWHTSTDTSVPIDGTLKLAAAYHDAGLPVELHIYPYGPHGICLANEFSSDGKEHNIQPLAEGWVESADKWIKSVT